MVERVIKTAHVIALMLIGANNFFTGLIRADEIHYFIINVIPLFVLIPFILFLVNNYKFNAFLFAALGIVTTIMGYEGNFSGVVFIIFSVYIFNNLKTNALLLILTVLAIGAKSVIHQMTFSQSINIYIVYIYIIVLYFIMIHPVNPKVYKQHYMIDDNLKIILQMLINGRSTKEIAEKLFISPGAVNKRIIRFRKEMDCNNNEEMIYILGKKGYFSEN